MLRGNHETRIEKGKLNIERCRNALQERLVLVSVLGQDLYQVTEVRPQNFIPRISCKSNNVILFYLVITLSVYVAHCHRPCHDAHACHGIMQYQESTPIVIDAVMFTGRTNDQRQKIAFISTCLLYAKLCTIQRCSPICNFQSREMV